MPRPIQLGPVRATAASGRSSPAGSAVSSRPAPWLLTSAGDLHRPRLMTRWAVLFGTFFAWAFFYR